LEARSEGWIAGLQLVEEVVAGPLADQSAPHGLLAKVRDPGLLFISVNRVEPGQEKCSQVR